MTWDDRVPRAAELASGRWKMPGTYVLAMELKRADTWVIGRLGLQRFPAGCYLYVGSALGPGGLAARIGRHLRSEKRVHWHIDYLLKWTDIRQIGYRPSTQRLECAWTAALLALPGARIVVPRFGASDCRCSAHLIYWETLPDWPRVIDIAGVWLADP